MGKKWVALITLRERKATITTFYARRVGEDVFDTWEKAVTCAANTSRRMHPEDKERIVSYGWREATKKEIEDWETK